jgi:hypothetical protein
MCYQFYRRTAQKYGFCPLFGAHPQVGRTYRRSPDRRAECNASIVLNTRDGRRSRVLRFFLFPIGAIAPGLLRVQVGCTRAADLGIGGTYARASYHPKGLSSDNVWRTIHRKERHFVFFDRSKSFLVV